MSRLLKKKPDSERKKKKEDSENTTDSEVSSDQTSISKSVTVASPLKLKQEKNLAEIKTSEPNFFQKAIDFLTEVKVELKKVTWPTRKQVTGTTIVVIIFVFVVAAFLGLFDFGLAKLVQVVLT
ncbi:MAG: preprotein translocase subunit SecE [Desulfobacterales bacterium RIFOXYA12_FULL_46_15]|nr:MAG: preprotein translocase subunit SecE [Desulfobacula sp. GWF2_41_7]OGR26577.1 MAG: preprotein translocase subunit SecE [Desulfobacterales bacterium RIFOXYA12_FULL_46_15]